MKINFCHFQTITTKILKTVPVFHDGHRENRKLFLGKIFTQVNVIFFLPCDVIGLRSTYFKSTCTLHTQMSYLSNAWCITLQKWQTSYCYPNNCYPYTLATLKLLLSFHYFYPYTIATLTLLLSSHYCYPSFLPHTFTLKCKLI